MNDCIIRGTMGSGSVRAFVAVTTDCVNEAFAIHNTSPVASAALGRLLTASAIMGSMLKNDTDLVTLSIRADGPLQGLVATSDCCSRVKGYVYNPDADLPLKPNHKLDVSGAVGEGSLTVIRDTGLKEPYAGQIPIVSGEIAEDLTYYFAKSEQTPSAVALGVLVDRDYSIRRAGGFILQMMPGADEGVTAKLEKTLAGLPSFTQMLEDGPSPEGIFEKLADGIGYSIHDMTPVTYYCNCSRDRVEKALISVGREELEKILRDDKKAELHCHFCNQNYQFSEDDLKAILHSLNQQ